MTSDQSKAPLTRELGRPRTFSDEDAYAALVSVVKADGYNALTLAAIAKRLGITGQALNARYGSRTQLLLDYVDWLAAQESGRFCAVQQRELSPLEALRDRFSLRPESGGALLAGAAERARILALAAESERLPEYVSQIQARVSAFEMETAQLIEEANHLGELHADDPATLSHLIVIAATGAGILGPASGSTADQEVRRALELLLKPFLSQ